MSVQNYRRFIIFIISCIVGLVVLTSCGSGGPRDLRVKKVFDGDTLLLTNGEKVRLIGIDCPEVHENDKLYRDARRHKKDIAFLQAQGRRASEFTSDLVLGKKVMLTYDIEKRDQYGRLLAYVYFEGTETDRGQTADLYMSECQGTPCVFLNASIVKAGLAYPMTIPPNTKHAALMKELYQTAQKEKKGFWN